MSIESLFSKPQKLIDRAQRALNSADTLLLAFFHPSNGRYITEVDGKTGENVRKLQIIRPLPDAFEENLTNALNNARNAFDQILFAACKAIGKPLRDGHYPWTDTPTNLCGRLVNKETGEQRIPSEFWDIIKAQKPYIGGDGYEGCDPRIRSMAKFANRKHTLGVEVKFAASGEFLDGMMMAPGTESFRFLPFGWDASPNEAELFRWRGEKPHFSHQRGISVNVTLDESAPAEIRKGSPVDMVRLFAHHAQTCLDEFKGRCLDLSPE